MKTPKNYKKSLQEGKLTDEIIKHVLFSYDYQAKRAKELMCRPQCSRQRMCDFGDRCKDFKEKVEYLSKKFNIKPEEIKREPNEVLSMRFCNEAYKVIINENKYKFYRNEIVRNEETGRFNISVSPFDPNDTLLKEDQESLSLYRSTTEGGNSYRYYVVGNNDYIYVTKIKGKYNYDFMDFGGFNK